MVYRKAGKTGAFIYNIARFFHGNINGGCLTRRLVDPDLSISPIYKPNSQDLSFGFMIAVELVICNTKFSEFLFDGSL